MPNLPHILVLRSKQNMILIQEVQLSKKSYYGKFSYRGRKSGFNNSREWGSIIVVG